MAQCFGNFSVALHHLQFFQLSEFQKRISHHAVNHLMFRKKPNCTFTECPLLPIIQCVFFTSDHAGRKKKKFIGLSSVIQGFECGHLQEDDWSTKKSSQAILVLSKGFCGTKRLQWCALTLEVLYAAFKSGAWALEHITHCRARQKHTCHQQTPLQHLKRSLAVFTPAGVRRWLRDFCHMVKSLLHFWTLTYFFFCGYICFYSSSNNCKSTHKKCLEPSHLVAHCDRTTPTLLLQPMVHVIERQ